MSYKSDDIRVLDEISHIRLNPGMYIGNTSNPVHLIEEALDNSLDEAMGGHAKIIAIKIDTKSNIFEIIDNGRGIPIENDVAITISSKLFSGAKFQDDKKTVYEICAGIHGVGLVAVNALSDFYNVEIYRDNKHALFEFKNAKFFKKEIKDFKESRPFSTRIQFKPSKKIFEKLIPDIDRIRNRILFASIELTDVTFVLIVDDKKEIIRTNLNDYFNNYCLSNTDSEITNIIDIRTSINPEKFNVKFCYSINGAITSKVQSSVNLLPVESGGTHINYFYDILREFFSSKAKRLGIKFQTQDSLCGLRAYLSLALKKPEFSGQTKDKLINRKSYLEKLANKLKSSIEEYFSKNQELLESLLRHFEAYRKNVDAKKLKGNNGAKRSFTKFTKLRDCTSKNGELFVCEGNSAGGSLIQCRDPRIHAILPLKGKIPNVVSAKDILKNKEIGELIQALGTGVEKHFDISKLRYSKIICAADADPDGAHISSLLTMVLSILVPDVIKNGHYYIAITPLYAISEKKEFTPLWNKEDLEKAMKDGKNINRFKGLGEMNPNQLKKCLIDEKTRNLIPITYSENMENMIKLFSDVSHKRELLKNDSINSIIK